MNTQNTNSENEDFLDNEQEFSDDENQIAHEDLGSEDIIGENQDDELRDKLEESQDKYARLLAEFDNYKKRTSREKVELIQSAGKDIIYKLLPVLDDLDRATASMDTTSNVTSIREGVDLVFGKFRKLLEQQGLKEMDIIGQDFDPEYEEAITAIPAPSEDMKNKVVDVVEKGYLLNDKVIRFAKVIIGK